MKIFSGCYSINLFLEKLIDISFKSFGTMFQILGPKEAMLSSWSFSGYLLITENGAQWFAVVFPLSV